MVIDSNILIYAFLSRWVEDPAACLASVSRIEVLGFPRWNALDEARKAKLEALVGAMLQLPLDPAAIAALRQPTPPTLPSSPRPKHSIVETPALRFDSRWPGMPRGPLPTCSRKRKSGC